MKKIVTIALFMLSFCAYAQDSSKFTVEILNRILGQYQDCQIVSQEFAIVKNSDRNGVVDYNGNIVLPVKYKEIGDFSDGMAVVKDENDKFGYVDENFKFVIPCKYKMATIFYNGMAVVMDQTSKFINKAGQVDEVASEMLNQCFPVEYKYGFCYLLEDSKLLYINSSGKVNCVQTSFDLCELIKGGFAALTSNDKCSIVTSEGKVTPFIYDKYYKYVDGYLIVEKAGSKGIINKYGEMVIPCIYEHIVNFAPASGYVVAKNNGKYGVLTIQGKQIFPFAYSAIVAFNGNIFNLQSNQEPYNKWVDRKGAVYFEEYPGDCMDTKDGYAIFKKDDNWYAHNENGFYYSSKERPVEFYKNFAKIYHLDKYGIINRASKIVLPCEYNKIRYEYGLFHVWKGDKSSYVECVDIEKMIDEFKAINEQANKALQNKNYEEMYSYSKKADEKLAEIEMHQELYASEVHEAIKKIREQIKRNIEWVSDMLKDKQ